MLTATQLLRKDELARTTVHVPEWADGPDDEVMLRVMDGTAMSVYQSRMQETQRGEPDASDTEKARAQALAQHEIRKRLMVEYCAACIIDPETDSLVFDTPEKIEILASRKGRGLERVFAAATKLHLDDQEAAQAFSKNFGATPDAGSGGSMRGSTASDTPTGSSAS
jgi:hypothetical protein